MTLFKIDRLRVAADIPNVALTVRSMNCSRIRIQLEHMIKGNAFSAMTTSENALPV